MTSELAASASGRIARGRPGAGKSSQLMILTAHAGGQSRSVGIGARAMARACRNCGELARVHCAGCSACPGDHAYYCGKSE